MQKGKQAKYSQLEISNSLESQYKERDEKLSILFMKAKLIPPKMFEILARSDSGKVISNLHRDLENELREFYEEFSDKSEILFKILFPNIKTNISFEIPEEIIETNLFDKMLLIQGGIISLQKYLRDQGKSEAEIDKHISELLVTKALNNSKDQIDPDYYDVQDEIKEDLPDDISMERKIKSDEEVNIDDENNDEPDTINEENNFGTSDIINKKNATISIGRSE